MMTTWRFTKYATSLFLLATLLVGCFQSDYTKLVKSELAKGIRKDSILLGINLGDTKDDFYGRCFDLNKAALVTQGPGNSSVQYLFKDSLVHSEPTEIRLLFYPSFDDQAKISDMKLEFSYTGWAPWNKKLQSDSLQVNAMKLLMRWYGGNEFVTAEVGGSKIPVKLDGNRRLLIFIKDPQSVIVTVQDILHPKFRHSISSGETKEEKEN